MAWWQLDAYLKHLPMDSALITEQRDSLTDEQLAEMAQQGDGKARGRWSRGDFLLAEVIDATERLRYIQTIKSVKDANSVPAPSPYPRPGIAAQPQRKVDPRKVAYLTRILEQHNREAS